MEQFEMPQNNVKEKSYYVMNLDTPRIIIISVAVIGIIAVSFLLGMNFMRGDSSIGSREGVHDSQKDLDILKSTIPGPEGQDLSKPAEEKTAVTEKEDKSGSQRSSTTTAKSDTVDLLTGDNINDAEAPVKEPEKKEAVRKPAAKKVAVKKQKQQRVAPRDTEHVAESTRPAPKKRAKKKVMEVAADEMEEQKPERSAAGQFAIQVAAFDSRSKADHEVRALKELEYEAHISQTTVDGRRYYRVQIGPFASKKKALSTLNRIQENEKYGNAYMLKERR